MCFGVFVQVNEGRYKQGKTNPIGYVIQENGCWEWVGGMSCYGYGRWRIGKRTYDAHLAMYLRTKGAVPAGLQLDHLCRNRKCVNPDHLEAVTPKVNSERGFSPTAIIARSGKCKRGHSEWKVPQSGRRYCITCDIEKRRRRYAVEYEQRRQEGRPIRPRLEAR